MARPWSQPIGFLKDVSRKFTRRRASRRSPPRFMNIIRPAVSDAITFSSVSPVSRGILFSDTFLRTHGPVKPIERVSSVALLPGASFAVLRIQIVERCFIRAIPLARERSYSDEMFYFHFFLPP